MKHVLRGEVGRPATAPPLPSPVDVTATEDFTACASTKGPCWRRGSLRVPSGFPLPQACFGSREALFRVTACLSFRVRCLDRSL